MRLILGCGINWKPEKEDDIGIDILAPTYPAEGSQMRWFDLNTKSRGWDIVLGSGYEHISAIHVIEHLDNLVNFMDGCWDLLQPGGSLYLETPLAGVNPDLEFADPTHKRCYRIHTFANYFSIEGVKTFGYTKKAWNFFVLRVQNDCIIVHAYPIK